MLESWHDRLRPGQREIADWTGGRLAVSAAGKNSRVAACDRGVDVVIGNPILTK